MTAPADFAQQYLDRKQQSEDDALDQEYAQILAGSPMALPTAQLQDPAAPAPAQDPSLVGRVAGDIGGGLVHLPTEVYGGAVDAVHQEATTVKDLADWVSSKLPNALRGGIAYSPDKGLHFASGDEIQALPGALESIAKLVPTTEPSGTVTGGIERGIAQYLTGKTLLGPILGNVGKAGLAGNLAEQAAVGATAFDPQSHVSDLIQQVPALQNPVNEWLASDPSDTAAEGRLKNAIEAVGLGLASEGVMKALKVVKAKTFAYYAEKAAGDEQGLARQVVAQVDQQNQAMQEIIGDAAQPAVQIKPRIPQVDPELPPEQAARAVSDSHATGPGEVKLNWAAMQEPQDVKAAIQTLADAHAKEMGEAKGFKSWAATRASAAELDAFQIARGELPKGSLDENQMLALKEFFIQSGRETKRLADMVAAGRGGDFARIAFERQYSLHTLIQDEFAGAKATAARTLNILKTRGNVDALTQANQFAELRSMVSGSNIDELAKGISQFGNAGEIGKMNDFIKMNKGATNGERIRQLWYGSLLSNPKTHVRNLVGNTANLLMDFPETAFAEGSDTAAEKMFGLLSSYRDAWTLMKRGRNVVEGDLTAGLHDALGGSKIDRQLGGAFKPEGAGLDPNSMTGRFFRLMEAGTTWQGRFLDAQDRVFKAMNWHMERRAIAFRQVKEELASGTLTRENMPARLADLMANPDEAAKQAARAFADVKTFTNQPLNTSTYQAVSAMGRWKFWGPFLLPFKKTPYNIATQILQRTPAAPLMTSWKQDIAAGGTRAELAWSRFVLGNAALLTAADLTLSGHLTGQGPADPAKRATLARQGWKPWSAKIGDTYVDLRSLGPIGPLLGLGAFTAETIAGQDEGDDTDRSEHAATMAALSIGAQMMDQSYLSGMSNFMDAVTDPKRAGDSFIQQAIGSAVIPRGVAQLERIIDPLQRDTHDVVSSLRAQTPGLSEALPIRRDLWGRPITGESGMGWVYDMVSPFTISKEKAEPIDQEITKLGARVALPDKKVSFRVLTPRGYQNATVDLYSRRDVYQRYLELQGSVVPEMLSGKPLLAALNDLVTGKHPLSPLYDRMTDGPDGGKADQIQALIRETREAAKTQLLEEFPDIKAEAEAKASNQTGRFALP